MPERIQRRRTKGWRMPAGAVYVGRPSRWGNPFRVGAYLPFPYKELGPPLGAARVRDHAHAVELFEAYARITSGFALCAQDLAGKDLVCWCPLVDAEGRPVPCHADVLLEIANGQGEVAADVWFGFAYPSKDTCPDAATRHTPAPRGYLAWHEWARRKQRTHRVERCPRCGYWAIWVPKTETERGAA